MTAPTVTVTVSESWHVDGNLLPAMRAAGYPAFTWRAGRVRTIPKSLALKCKHSGAQLTTPEDDDLPDNLPGEITVPPLPADHTEKVRAALREKYKTEKFGRVHFPQGFSDGYLANEFAALDRPPHIGVHEIVELPLSLLQRILSSGGVFDTETTEFEGAFQDRFRIGLEAWRKRKAQERKQSEQDEKTGATMKRIEELTERLVKARKMGKGKLAETLAAELESLWRTL